MAVDESHVCNATDAYPQLHGYLLPCEAIVRKLLCLCKPVLALLLPEDVPLPTPPYGLSSDITNCTPTFTGYHLLKEHRCLPTGEGALKKKLPTLTRYRYRIHYPLPTPPYGLSSDITNVPPTFSGTGSHCTPSYLLCLPREQPLGLRPLEGAELPEDVQLPTPPLRAII